jgi:hypothetical protein
MTEYHGWVGSRPGRQGDIHGWAIHVYARFDPKVDAACATAKSGFEADLNEGPQFLSGGDRSYMFARFEHHEFRWGRGVSFLSQFAPDAIYAPNNGHLQYEVWGVTPDRRYTIVASISVRHPNLTEWGPGVRDLDSIEALKDDPDYKLIERCSPDDFMPSLTAFDRLVDSIRIR